MKTLIISGSSDLGNSYINFIKKSKIKIVSTYFRKKIKNNKITQIHLDLKDKSSVKKFLDNKEIQNWTNLIILTGNLEPVGKFENVKIEDWIKNYKLNFLSQIYLLKNLLNYKNKYLSKVIFTSGGSTNSDDENLSSYNLAKIGLIKLCELLNREIKNTSFICLGPGFIDTKIHDVIKNNPDKYRDKNGQYVKKKYTTKFKPKDFSKKLDLIIKSNINFYEGRNISLQNDNIDNDFLKTLSFDENIYKLRRDFNNIITSDINFDLNNFINFIFKDKNFHYPGSATHTFFARILKLYFVKK
ncbi:SDR family NAD(P)-dependent oxidoreductase, partial [Candidatus Pelagibacter bacterium]